MAPRSMRVGGEFGFGDEGDGELGGGDSHGVRRLPHPPVGARHLGSLLFGCGGRETEEQDPGREEGDELLPG